MKSSDKKFAVSYGMFLFGFVAGLVVAVMVINQGFMSKTIAKQSCTVEAPCSVDNISYTNGSICKEEKSSCGYISTTETIVDRTSKAPKCSCQFPF